MFAIDFNSLSDFNILDFDSHFFRHTSCTQNLQHDWKAIYRNKNISITCYKYTTYTTISEDKTIKNKAKSSEKTSCFIAKQDCFIAEQDHFTTEQDCFITEQYHFTTAKDCIVTAEDCFITIEFCFMEEQFHSMAVQNVFVAEKYDYMTVKDCFVTDQNGITIVQNDYGLVKDGIMIVQNCMMKHPLRYFIMGIDPCSIQKSVINQKYYQSVN